MLRRFEWIRDGGFFDAFLWDRSLPDCKRINVIYGSNGSGKSSLSRVLQSLRESPHGHEQISITLNDNGSQRTTNGRSDPIFDRILVFNDEFVSRNHRFSSGEADMKAVLTLGLRTTEQEKELEDLRAERQRLTNEQAATAQPDLDRDLNQAYGRVAQAIVNDNSRAGGVYSSRSSYSIARVKSRLAEARHLLVSLEPEQLAAKKQMINGGNKEQVAASTFSLAIPHEVARTAARLFTATPVTAVLDTLNAHPAATGWVQDGAKLHKESDCCIFCSGSLTTDRKDEIERHFSSEVSQLQRELNSLDGDLQKLGAVADSIGRSIPASGLMFDDLRSEFDLEATSVNCQLAELTEWVSEVRARISRKLANVLVAIDHGILAPPSIEGAPLAEICIQHNVRVGDHTQLVQGAARAIELHHLESEEPTIVDLIERRNASASRKADIADRLSEISADIGALENPDGDPTPSAHVLTQEVGRLLGRDELRFEASGKRYEVLRNGSPATGLSVGERTAITLVHFLETVACFDPADGKPIVVIDDPVSSLDSNIFMGVSTYIWSAAVTVTNDHIGQLFLFTHNFDLFRQWDIQIESLHKGRGMANSFPAELYELQSRYKATNGVSIREPLLAKWPESSVARKKMRSSYQHAFILMTGAHETLRSNNSLESRLDAQLLFPNLIRKVLESFLAFKRPDQTGDFTGAMRETTAMLQRTGYKGNADALRQQLTRYTHAYSHSENPNTNEVINPDEIAGALSAVFRFMRHLDEEHFDGLCKVVGTDPDILVPPVAEDEEGAP